MLRQPDIWTSLSELAWVFLDKAVCPEGVLGFPWEFFLWKIDYEMSGIWRGQQVPAACLGGELHVSLMLVYANFMDHPVYWDPVVSLYDCSNASCNVGQKY